MKLTKRMFPLFLAAFCLRGSAHGQDTLEAHVHAVDTRYAVDSWPFGPVREGVPLADLQLPGLVGGEVRPMSSLVQRAFAPAEAPAGSRPALLVQVLVADESESAHSQLVSWLANVSSGGQVPEDGAYGVELGQAGYVSPVGAGPRAFSWVAFVQGNVAVRLLNVDPNAHPGLDLLAFAQAIDARIVEHAPLRAGEPVPKPRIMRLSAAASQVVAGTPVKLGVSVVDAFAGEPALAWSVEGEGQGYVESRGGDWYLFTTGPGELTVTLTVVGTTASLTTGSVELVIADD